MQKRNFLQEKKNKRKKKKKEVTILKRTKNIKRKTKRVAS